MGKETKLGYEPDFVSPPGETLNDILEDRGMTQAEFAERTGHTRKHINEITKGKATISPETALLFERVLGVPASFWNNRESQYREWLAKSRESEALQQHEEWCRLFPTKEMATHGWIQRKDDPVAMARELLTFFGVASPGQWKSMWLNPGERTAFRKSLAFASSPGPLSAWLRFGEISGRKMECEPYNEKAFKEALRKIRELTPGSLQVLGQEMRQLCANAGVAVVFTPELPKTRVSGATQWLSPERALIQLSVRYKTDDHLCFTFFHEAGHILLHGKRSLFIEGIAGKSEDEREKEANEFASDYLIPTSELKSFVERGDFTAPTINAFAQRLCIAPGIVVGQLQHRGHVPFNRLNPLKRKIALAPKE